MVIFTLVIPNVAVNNLKFISFGSWTGRGNQEVLELINYLTQIVGLFLISKQRAFYTTSIIFFNIFY